MKRKIVGIVIFMLVATTVVSATNNTMKENNQPTSYSVDVPVWQKGDSWTYETHLTRYKYNQNGTLWYTLYHNYTSTLTITDDSGDNYTMKMTSKKNTGRATIGSFKLKFTPFTKLSGEWVIRKTDLAILRQTEQEKGFAFWLYGNIGFPILTQYTRTTEWINTPAWIYLPFPMTAGTPGTIPGYSFTYQEKCYLYWGLVKLFDWPVQNYTDSSHGYNCEMANITVPADTYDAYNVSVEYSYGLGRYTSWRYYVPDVGFVVKTYTNADWDTSGKPGMIYEDELVSFNYTP